jgi:hypothetical protein
MKFAMILNVTASRFPLPASSGSKPEAGSWKPGEPKASHP